MVASIAHCYPDSLLTSIYAARELSTAWYGAGVWRIDFSGPARNDDGITPITSTSNATNTASGGMSPPTNTGLAGSRWCCF